MTSHMKIFLIGIAILVAVVGLGYLIDGVKSSSPAPTEQMDDGWSWLTGGTEIDLGTVKTAQPCSANTQAMSCTTATVRVREQGVTGWQTAHLEVNCALQSFTVTNDESMTMDSDTKAAIVTPMQVKLCPDTPIYYPGQYAKDHPSGSNDVQPAGSGDVTHATCKDYWTAYHETGEVSAYQSYASDIYDRLNEQRTASNLRDIPFNQNNDAMNILAGMCKSFTSDAMMVNGGSFHDAVLALYNIQKAEGG